MLEILRWVWIYCNLAGHVSKLLAMHLRYYFLPEVTFENLPIRINMKHDIQKVDFLITVTN